jgi:tetratricopeptide (TPR) repeat protein
VDRGYILVPREPSCVHFERRRDIVKDAHLSVETLARLLAGDLDHEELSNQIVPHLLARCPGCQRSYEEIQRLQEEFGHWDERVAVFEGRQAPELFEKLADRPFDEQLSLVADDSSFQTWALCQLLLKKSAEAVFSDPVQAVNLAELAVNISRHLNAVYDPHWVLDLRARAYAYLGNARRVLGELRSAETAMWKAESCLTLSMTGNDLVRAEIFDLTASLRRAQRRFPEALMLWDQAFALYEPSGEGARLGDLLIKKAKALEDAGSPEKAIEELYRAAALLDPEKDTKLFFYARHNLLACLILVERYEQAAQILPAVQQMARGLDNPLNLVRLQWAEARIEFGLRRLDRAEGHFRHVRQEFLRRAMGFDAALVSLDLALLLAQEGRYQELKQLALEVIPVFEAQDVHREAMAAVLMFQKACNEETLTAELARQIASALEKSRQAAKR